MNNQNRHMRYRRSVYRRRRIRIAVIASVCAIVALALAFVIIGNVLASRTTPSDDGKEDGDGTETGTLEASGRSVSSLFVPLALDGSSLGERLASAEARGYSDVCFALDTENGYLYYKSDIAASLGKQKNAVSDLRTLSSIISLTSARSLYTTGVTYVPDMRSNDDLVRSAAIGYHAALITEAIREGVDDVLVMPGELDEQRYEELIRLADEVHRLEEDAYVGLALPASVFASEDASNLIYTLAQSYDFLAVRIDAETDMSGLLFYFLGYNVRAIVPDADTADAVSGYTQNIQIMP